jgi:hypothetical protein
MVSLVRRGFEKCLKILFGDPSIAIKIQTVLKQVNILEIARETVLKEEFF